MATSQVTSIRAHTARMIADNPTDITITRKTRTISGGKATSTDTALPTQTVRLYSKNSSELSREGEGDSFRFVRRRNIRLLAEYNADLKGQSNDYEDTFTIGDSTYLIADVREITWNGAVVSKQCSVEEKQ